MKPQTEKSEIEKEIRNILAEVNPHLLEYHYIPDLIQLIEQIRISKEKEMLDDEIKWLHFYCKKRKIIADRLIGERLQKLKGDEK